MEDDIMEKQDRLFLSMVEFYRGDPHQIQHFAKVHAYAGWIARQEGLDPAAREILDAAALTHDIGIRIARERHGTSTWKLQEELGPPAARPMLEEAGYDAAVTDRVCWLIGHHHTYTRIDGADYQILVEADFLVNFQEGNRPMGTLPHVYKTIFRTEAGRDLLRRMFDYTPEEPRS